ncbi:hypothetical protein ACFE04_008099 [Oxalis oulophora]
MEVRVRRSIVVKPEKDTPNERMWISHLDLLTPIIHVPAVYLYKPSDSVAANSLDTNVLIDALRKVLVLFYPLAGRLGRDEDDRIDINCNSEGALFIEAEVDECLADLGDFTPSPKLRQLVPTVDYSQDLSSYPLLILQVTFFKCGGLGLGTYVHHTLADGCSALHFVNTWCDIARGLSASVPPFLDRALLRPRDPPTPTFHHIEYDPPPTMINNSKTQAATSTLTLKLTLDQVNTLKAKAKKDETTHYSTYQILTAHIWRCVCKARCLSDDQHSKLIMTTDGRSRLRPPLPPGYFGNVLFTATSVAKSGDIISNPLYQTVENIHTALKRMDDEYLRSALDFLEMQPDLKALMRGAHTFRCPNLNVVSWIRLPIYEADFGWGRPIHMGRASVVFEGVVYILPSPSNDGSLSLTICLEMDHMELFKKFLYDF